MQSESKPDPSGAGNRRNKGEMNMEYRIKKNKKEYEVYINDKLEKTFINLELALDYIKWIKEMK